MMKTLASALLPCLALAACAEEPDALPRPDPALIERIAVANTAQGESAGKLAKADKLVAAVAHVEPDRVAGAAEKLLAR
jgi:starvation-inducible outer membrane lipoprotein